MGWSQIKKECKRLHAQDDIDYKNGCMTKMAFSSASDAKIACANMRVKHPNKQFNVYECRFCRKLHIGGLN